MPLVKTILENKLNEIFNQASMSAVKAMLNKMKQTEISFGADGKVNGATAPTDDDIAREFTDKFVDGVASKLATTIDEYIKSAKVITEPGQVVNVAGTPTAQVGATSAPGTGSIT
jgi:hypothetical protein